ncbi:MAG TPA: dethiobiotin synthase [Flavobacteriales bacterium]|nr:dethiobiotin synthase [Flavobacteriales bacterium]
MRKVFVTGIGTDVGKTIISAILTEALQADYWKPIQCGSLDLTDTERVKRLVESKQTVFHPEAYRLKTPASPHYAAQLENILISPDDLKIPETDNHLIIEGAGGIMVPLNNEKTFLDVFKQWNLPVILVSRHYLGSINHTLLSIDILKQVDIPIKGIIFVGEENKPTETVIENISGINILGRIDYFNELNAENIKKATDKITL